MNACLVGHYRTLFSGKTLFASSKQTVIWQTNNKRERERELKPKNWTAVRWSVVGCREWRVAWCKGCDIRTVRLTAGYSRQRRWCGKYFSNNCWWGWQNRTDLVKCTHQYDKKQGNSNTRALSTNCLLHVQEDKQQKTQLQQKTNCLSSCTWRRHFVESACVLLFPCFSSYWWVHFPRSVLNTFLVHQLMAGCAPPQMKYSQRV